MAEVVGSLGQGKLVVLQPASPVDGGVEVGIGLQRWWGRQIKFAGREGFWFLLGQPGTIDPRHLVVFDRWTESKLGEQFVKGLQCRWGLAPEMNLDEDRSQIQVRLFEVHESTRFHTIGEWSFQAENTAIPPFAHEVVTGVAHRLGVEAAPSWQDAFGSDDAYACMHFLQALGSVSLLEEGFTLGTEVAVDSVLATLDADPAMVAAHGLLEDLLRGMANRFGATEIELAGVLRRARAAARHSPAQWDGILERALQPAGD